MVAFSAGAVAVTLWVWGFRLRIFMMDSSIACTCFRIHFLSLLSSGACAVRLDSTRVPLRYT